MRYIIERALCRLKKNICTNSFVALQLCIGFIILFTAFNMNFSLQKRLSELQSNIKNTFIRVDVLNDSVEDGSFSYPLFASMKPNVNCQSGLVTTAIVKSTINGLPDSIIAMCVPNPYFRELFQSDMEADTVYCSEILKQQIQDGRVVIFGEGVEASLSEDTCIVDGKAYTISVFDNPNGITEIQRDENIEHNIMLDRILFFPQSAGDEWEHDAFISYQLYIYPQSSQYYLSAYEMIYENLGDISISIYDPAAKLIKNCQDITDMINLLTLISVVLLIITVVGSIGIMLITLYKRKKDIAVASAVGCPITKLYLEIFIEVLTVSAVGIFLGAICATPIISEMREMITFFTVNYSLWTVGISVFSVLFIPLIVTVLSILGLGKLNITALLHGDE